MKPELVIVVLVAFSAVAIADNVLSYFQKCKLNDENLSRCLTESANKAWPQLVKEDNSWNEIPIPDIERNIQNLFVGTLKNGRFFGLANAHFEEIVLDLERKIITIIFSCPQVSGVGLMSLKGSFLGFKLDENLQSNSTLYGGLYNYQFSYNLETRDNEQYIQITKSKLAYHIDRLSFDFKNPDKTREARNNKIFNDNWRVLNVLISSPTGTVLADTITPKIQKLLHDVPFNSLFE